MAGATLYLCGDGQHMAPAVHETCVIIYQEATVATHDEAEKWMGEHGARPRPLCSRCVCITDSEHDWDKRVAWRRRVRLSQLSGAFTPSDACDLCCLVSSACVLRERRTA